VCKEVRLAMTATIEAGASTMVISKSADDLYPIVSAGGKGESCRNLHYAFLILKKPYNGDKVAPKEWVEAMKLIMIPD